MRIVHEILLKILEKLKQNNLKTKFLNLEQNLLKIRDKLCTLLKI